MKILEIGFSSLPMLLLLGGIIVIFALGASLLIFSLNNANLGERLSWEALAAAQSGINDAILHVVRDQNCPDASCPANYTLLVGERSVVVTISKDFPQIGKHTIMAEAAAGINRRKLTAILQTGDASGETIIESLQETPL